MASGVCVLLLPCIVQLLQFLPPIVHTLLCYLCLRRQLKSRRSLGVTCALDQTATSLGAIFRSRGFLWTVLWLAFDVATQTQLLCQISRLIQIGEKDPGEKTGRILARSVLANSEAQVQRLNTRLKATGWGRFASGFR